MLTHPWPALVRGDAIPKPIKLLEHLIIVMAASSINYSPFPCPCSHLVSYSTRLSDDALCLQQQNSNDDAGDDSSKCEPKRPAYPGALAPFFLLACQPRVTRRRVSSDGGAEAELAARPARERTERQRRRIDVARQAADAPRCTLSARRAAWVPWRRRRRRL
jgi:hypothetical protein